MSSQGPNAPTASGAAAPDSGAPASGDDPNHVDIITLRPYARAFEGVLARLTRDGSVKLHECDSTADAVTLIRRLDGCILLSYSGTNDELVKQITLLKLLAPQIRSKAVRVVATTGMKNASVASSLTFYGASDVLEEPITERGLQFKLERQIKATAQQKARNAKIKTQGDSEGSAKDAPASAGKEVEKARAPLGQPSGESRAERQAGPGASSPKHQVIRQEPLTITSDFWLTDEMEAKAIRDRWLIRLVGPSPDLGKWMKAPGASVQRGGRGLWQWFPNEPEGRALYQEAGEWFFKGQRPEFQDHEWLFIASEPDLYFQAGHKVLGSKFRSDEKGNLLVAKDAPGAENLRAKVHESLANMNKKTLRRIKPGEEAETGADAKDEKKRKRHAGAAGSQDEAAAEAERELKLVDPLTLASDFWLLLDRKPKRIANRWVVKLVGPSPAIGKWASVSVDDTAWRWTPNNPKQDPFTKEPGEWVFHGMAPKFQEDVWLFVADRPELFFARDGKRLGAKLSGDPNGNLLAAQDSKQGLGFLPQIEESHRMVFHSESDKPEIEEPEEEKKKRDAEKTRNEEAESAQSAKEKQSLADPAANEEKTAAEVADENAVDEKPDPSSMPGTLSPDQAATDAVARVQGGEASKEFTGNLKSEAPSQNQSDHLSVRIDAPGKDLSATEGRADSKELSATEGKADSKELSATEGKTNSKELAANRSQAASESGAAETESSDRSEKRDLAIEKPRAADASSRSDAETEKGSGPDAGPPPRKPEDAVGIRAPRPPGPSLSPLTLAFLLSELISDRKNDLLHAARRYCAYVSASCGGLHVDLWCKRSDGWKQVASSKADLSTPDDAVRAMESDPKTRVVSPNTMASAVHYEGKFCGVIVIHGGGAEEVKPAYADAAARVVSGLVTSLCA